VQLEPESGSVRRRLVAASCALLGASTARSQDVSDPGAVGRLLEGWQVQSALAYYHEDGRIQAIEPLISAAHDTADGGKLELDFTFDSLSGSSPNGAIPSRSIQTFASPSAKSFATARHTYSIAPGRLPADPHYSDARVAFGAGWTLPLTRLMRMTVGGKFSYEDDFYSASVSAALERDFNDKNTTVAIGINDESDFLQPIGGAPVGLSNYNLFEKGGHESKNGQGVLLGVTQVMTRNWLAQANVSVDRFHGYLNDPYKIVSVIDPTGGPVGYVYENRPDSRTRRSVYLENRVGWRASSATVSFRYMTDTWGVHSDTAQLRLRWWNAAGDQYLEPSARWYRQTAADFYRPWILSTDASEPYASADSRLSDFRALTYGLKYGMKLGERLGRFGRDTTEFNVRLEYYQQTIQNGPAGPGTLGGLDLYPSLKAILFQVGFSY
jgi:Protein of unknown function (DUF3570)